MARYTGPKSRIARKFGEGIFGADKVLSKKNYPPGQHGNNRRRKTSEYGVMLAEKQKAKYTYGVLEKQFRNLFEKAASANGITGEILLQSLEARLDNVVFRLGIAPTRAAARQLVSHKHITVDGKVVNIPSFSVKPGQIVGVRERSKSLEVIANSLAGFNHSKYPWLECAEFAAGYALLHWLHCKPLLFSVAMTLIPVLITGGIHLDGFADTVDAMSSYAERERRLEILKDPHTGAFAIIGLCCYFLANIGIWSEIGEKKLLVACCIFAFSRAMSGLAVVSFKAAKNSGLLRTFQDGAAKRRVRVVMMLWAVLTAFILLKISPAAGTAALAMGIAIYVYYYLFNRKYFGGTTGDLAGYFLQLCELGMLAGIMLAG